MRRAVIAAAALGTAIAAVGIFYGARSLTRIEVPIDPGDSTFPKTYAEAEPRLVPIVRNRVGQENARLLVADDVLGELLPVAPHRDLGGELWGELALETPTQFVRVPAGQWKAWGLDFDTAFVAAVKRLDRSTRARLQTGPHGVYRGVEGNENATALLLLPIFEGLGFGGPPIFAAPRPNVLLVADSSNADARAELDARLRATCEADEHDNCDYGVWTANAAGRFAPVTDGNFQSTARLAHFARAKAQTEILRKKVGDRDDSPFVASVFVVRGPTGDEFSYVVHTERTKTLLPRAEYVSFIRVDDETKVSTPLAIGKFEKVQAIMGARWQKTQLYPERWLVEAYPTNDELTAIGFEKGMLSGKGDPAHP